MATKFLTMIKSNDEFDKIVLECYIKHGYKLLKIGSGNYVINPHSQKYNNNNGGVNADSNPEVLQ